MLRTALALAAACSLAAQDYKSWRDYAGTADSAQYTALTQITRDNVKNLQVAWTYPTGDNRRYSFAPLMANGMLYVLGKGNSIVALNAATGKEIWSYAPAPAFAQMTTRGINHWQSKDGKESRLFFTGNHALRALDAKTGRPIESFGVNGAVDLKQGLDRDPAKLTVVGSMSPGRVFEDLIIVGTATNQGYGSAPGDIRAFDVRTGRRLWHFQMVHHDIWDYDNATAPKLLTIRRSGRNIDVVAQPGKQGFLWVFDRVTGAPIWPIEERPVPKSDVPNEEAWPTQPFPTAPPPFSRQKFTVDDLSPFLTPDDRARFRDALLSARNEGLFTPPATRGTIQMPGNNGGSNWGGAAVDPTKGRLYLVNKDLPAILKLERDPKAPEGVERYVSGFNLVTDTNGLSPVAPPWTSLVAYDLNEGTIAWKVPLGDTPGHKGTGVHYPKIGPVVTATGLIFTGARDKHVRATDAATGKVVWEMELPTAMEGIPAVYEIAGRQFLVFCAAAQAGLTRATEERIEGAYIALALPK